MSKMRVKDIKRDEVEVAVADATGRLRLLATTHRKSLSIALGALAVLALAITGARWWVHRQAVTAQVANAAAGKLAAAIENPPEAKPGETPATPPTWTEVAAAYQAVANDFPSTTPGRLAAFQAGVAHLRAGDAPTAITVLTAFVTKEPAHWATPHALQTLAVAQEQSGDLAAAEATLKQVKDAEWQSYPPGTAIQRLAEFYDRQSRVEDARELWRLLADDSRFAETRAQEAAKAKLAEAAASAS
jgi:predicted negative regulator of RcsB-dependent stress response